MVLSSFPEYIASILCQYAACSSSLHIYTFSYVSSLAAISLRDCDGYVSEIIAAYIVKSRSINCLEFNKFKYRGQLLS